MAEQIDIEIQRVGTERLLIPVVGTAPLIMNRWSEKARRELLESQQGKKKMKVARDPEAEYQEAAYRISVDGQDECFGFPALAFKSATVESARFFPKSVLTLVTARQSFFFKGIWSKTEPMSLVKIDGTPELREDVVRVGRGGTMPRFRAQFTDWKAVLDMRYVTATLDRGTAINCVETGGEMVGVGEWRPEKSGEFGTYIIDGTRQVCVVNPQGELEEITI